VLPGTTEDQGVLWYMSTVLLMAFGFFYVATPFRPPYIARDENIFRRNAVALPLYRSLHDVLRLTEGCNGGPVRLMYTNSTPTHTNNDEQTCMLPETKGRFCRHF
jgi:hypothetical protein